MKKYIQMKQRYIHLLINPMNNNWVVEKLEFRFVSHVVSPNPNYWDWVKNLNWDPNINHHKIWGVIVKRYKNISKYKKLYNFHRKLTIDWAFERGTKSNNNETYSHFSIEIWYYKCNNFIHRNEGYSL